MNFYKRHLGDYAKHAGHLSLLEHGAFTLLLDRYYTTEKPIASATEAYRICHARTKDERAAVDVVLKEFFQKDGDQFVNDRAEEEIQKADHQRTVNREIGKRGGRPKKTEQETESVTESDSDSLANRNPSQTPDTRHQTKPSVLDTQSVISTTPGEVCACLKALGYLDVNPANPKLIALIDAGASLAEFQNAAKLANVRKFAYVIGMVKGQREEAAGMKLHTGAMPTRINRDEGRALAAESLLQQDQPVEIEITPEGAQHAIAK